MDRRAFTLLELLIALAILVAMSSLVMPGVLARLTVARGEEARTMLDASIVEARGVAARSGEVVRVVSHEQADGRFAIVHETMRLDDDDAPASDDGLLGLVNERAARPAGADRRTTVHLVLPDSCRLMTVADLEAAIERGGGLVAERAPDAPHEPDRIVAVVFPDGGLAPGEELALVTPRGQAYKMSVRHWGGGVAFEAWDPLAEAEAAFPDDSLGGPARGREP
jgi:prepilin-type N-terminal cleavage/methylation domain-containing protein